MGDLVAWTSRSGWPLGQLLQAAANRSLCAHPDLEVQATITLATLPFREIEIVIEIQPKAVVDLEDWFARYRIGFRMLRNLIEVI